jgi:hypothetical protein
MNSFYDFCKLSKDMGPQNDADLEIMWVIPFPNVIGSFMYAIACTRHDIAQAMGVLNQFMVNPMSSHWIAKKWIFCFAFLEVSCMKWYAQNIILPMEWGLFPIYG